MINNGEPNVAPELLSEADRLFERVYAIARTGTNEVSRSAFYLPIAVHTEHGDIDFGDETHSLQIIGEERYIRLRITQQGEVMLSSEDYSTEGVNNTLAEESAGLTLVSNEQGLQLIEFLDLLVDGVEAGTINEVLEGEEIVYALARATDLETDDEDDADHIQAQTVKEIKEKLERLTLNQPPHSHSSIGGLLYEKPGEALRRLYLAATHDDYEMATARYSSSLEDHFLNRDWAVLSDKVFFKETRRDHTRPIGLEITESPSPESKSPEESLLQRGYRRALESDMHLIDSLLTEIETVGFEFRDM